MVPEVMHASNVACDARSRNQSGLTGDLLMPADPAAEFASHQVWLRTVILSRLGNREEADEVLQEVALAAANQSSRPEVIHRVGPWLYRVALRQILLLRRRQGRRRKLLAGFTTRTCVTDECPHSSTPLEWMLSEERGQMVKQGLASLSERDRQLLMLKYIDGLSYEEIGAILGVTASSVQSRLHRARKLLRNKLISLQVIDKASQSK